MPITHEVLPRKQLAIATALLVPLLALTGCSNGGGGVTDVGAKEAITLAAQSDVKVIDVRTPQEFAAGHLPNAINIDIEASTFDTQVKQLPVSAKYFVYCRSGNRSGVATNRMSAEGFTSLYDLQGGIQQWAAAGGSVVS